MDIRGVHERDAWAYLKTLLPEDLEETARESQALVRARGVPNASALIRLALAYALSDLSLKDVAAWAHAQGVASISGPGLFYRMQVASEWLRTVLARVLEEEIEVPLVDGFRLRVVDATVVTGPGSRGTDWRAHVLVDPVGGQFRSVELTDASGGEKLSRFEVGAGEVVLGDRAYATARGLHAVRSCDGHVLARLNVHTLRVCDGNRRRIWLKNEESRVPTVGAIDIDILIPIPPPDTHRTKSHKPWKLSSAIAWLPARAIAARVRTGTIIWLITTLPHADLSPARALELYRLRWQIELVFKRMKSLLHLDALPTRHGPMAQPWMLARLLAAALAQRLVRPTGPLSPWGYEVRAGRPHS